MFFIAEVDNPFYGGLEKNRLHALPAYLTYKDKSHLLISYLNILHLLEFVYVNDLFSQYQTISY